MLAGGRLRSIPFRDPAKYGQFGFPVVGDRFPGDHRRCHADILTAIEQGIRKVTDALAQLELNHAITYISVSFAESFANLNTPEEVRRYRNG